MSASPPRARSTRTCFRCETSFAPTTSKRSAESATASAPKLTTILHAHDTRQKGTAYLFGQEVTHEDDKNGGRDNGRYRNSGNGVVVSRGRFARAGSRRLLEERL